MTSWAQKRFSRFILAGPENMHILQLGPICSPDWRHQLHSSQQGMRVGVSLHLHQLLILRDVEMCATLMGAK